MSTYMPICDGCEFYAYGSGRYVLHTPDQRYFLVSSTTKELLEALTRSTPLEEICADLTSSGESTITTDELKSLLEKRFNHLGIFACPPAYVLGSAPDTPPLINFTFLRCWDLLPAVWVGLVAARLSWLYGKASVILAVATIIGTHLALYSLGRESFQTRLSHGSPLIILSLSLLSILAHELGHGTALLRFGARPGRIGFGLYILMPTFFADVSQVWRLPRRARFAVDLGGIYFQQAIFAIYAAFAIQYRSLEFAAACFAIDAMTIFALNPVFRFDGYWLLADWLDLPKLHRDAITILKHWGGRLVRHKGARSQNVLALPRLSGSKL